jgi:hypothetical protein
MRILELICVDTIPNLALKEPAGHQLLLPEQVGREAIFCQQMCERHSAIDRSSIRSITLQMAQKFADFHDGFACWRPPPDRDRRRHPTLPDGVYQ